MAKSYRISTCRLCLSEEMQNAVPLPPTVIGDHYVTDYGQVLEKFPIDLYFCSQCAHIQLLDVVDPKILFDENFSYMPSKNEKLQTHFIEYAEFIDQYTSSDIKCCLDIGSNDGLFLSVLKEKYGCNILGVDPAKGPADYANKQGLETWICFFDKDVSDKIIKKFGKVDIVSANNVFAHTDDLITMANCISEILSDDGVFCFEFSYLTDIVNKGLIGTVFHEHLSYHSLYSIIPFLRRAGLELVDVKRVNTQGGAAIGVAKKVKPSERSSVVGELLDEEKELGVDSLIAMHRFRDRINEDKNKVKNIIQSIPKNEKIVAFGASRSANLLIEFFELGNYLEYIIDDNINKINKYVPYHNIPICDSKILKNNKPDYVVILAWIHTDKITRVIKNIDNGIKVISLFPNISII